MKKLFTIIGFAGALIACQPESLTTSFKPKEATATITLTVKDINNPDRDMSKENIDVQFIPSNGISGTQNGFVYEIKGTEQTNFAIGACDVNIKTKWTLADGNTFENALTDNNGKAFHIPALVAGESAHFNVIMVIGEPTGIDEYKFDTEETKGDAKNTVAYLTRNDHAAPYTHAGTFAEDMLWGYNNSEFVLCAPITYDAFAYYVSNDDVEMESGFEQFENIVKNFCDSWNTPEDQKFTHKEEEYAVAAWARYSYYQQKSETPCTIAVFAVDKTLNKTEIGHFTAQYFNSLEGSEQAAIPGKENIYHANHGHYDHSHSHGPEAQNAGGGIVWAD